MHRAGRPAGRCVADESGKYQPGEAVIITALPGAAAALLSLPRDPVPREQAALADGFCADRTSAINDHSSGWQTRRRCPG